MHGLLAAAQQIVVEEHGGGTPLWQVLVPALIGGAVVALLGPVTRAPREIDEHDNRLAELNLDGAAWFERQSGLLDSQLARITTVMQGTGNLHSGAHRNQREQAAEERAGEMQVYVQRAARERERMRIAERWWHRAWRRLRRRPMPELSFVASMDAAQEEWRARARRASIG